MKVTKTHVQTFRSIVDSGIVDIEDGVTVVIGKNEQGKTNFLRAIRAFNSEERFTPGDLPNHLRPSLEDSKLQEIPIISIWFALEATDKKKLAGVVQDVESVSQIKCTRHYGNNYRYWETKNGQESLLQFAVPDISGPVSKVKATVADLKTKLLIHATRMRKGSALERSGTNFPSGWRKT